MKKVEMITTTEDTGMRVDTYLADKIKDYSRSQIQDLIKQGRLTINGQIAKANYRLSSGELLVLSIPVISSPVLKPENIELDIIYERSEEHTSELHSRPHLVCRLLLEKKKNKLHTSVHSIKSVPLRPRFRPLATAILPQDPRGGRPHDRAHTCPDVLSLRGVFDARAPL